jgi:gas vesicle protein
MNMRSSLIFLGGVAMGTVLGLLIAPEPGRITVKKIKREADRLVDKVEGLKERAHESQKL